VTRHALKAPEVPGAAVFTLGRDSRNTIPLNAKAPPEMATSAGLLQASSHAGADGRSR